MPNDFAAFILTHGRPDNVVTMKTLDRCGYTGRVFIVVDDEDKTADEYRAKFGAERVLVFSKTEIAQRFDEADNFDDRRAIFYARNAVFDLARKVGVKHFIQLDDDYTSFTYRLEDQDIACNLDKLFRVLVDFLEESGALSVAIAQGGDWLGGRTKGNMRRSMSLVRKVMNTFICSVDRPFAFHGRINEDVSTYTMKARMGALFFTVMRAKIIQMNTQSNEGGMTDIYRAVGTYVKSFYSVMHCPSSVKIGTIVDNNAIVPNSRFHHDINWHATAPRIIDEKHRKAGSVNA